MRLYSEAYTDAFFTKLAIELHSRHARLHWQSLPLLLLHTSQRLSQLPQNGSVIDNWTDCGGCTLNSVIRTFMHVRTRALMPAQTLYRLQCTHTGLIWVM